MLHRAIIMKGFTGLAILSLAAFTAACSAAPTPTRGDENLENPTEQTPDSEPVGVEGEGTPEGETPATTTPKSLSGTLAAGPTAKYGGNGSGFCDYTMTFSDISVSLTNLTSSKPTATVKNKVVEASPSCQGASTIPTTAQSFAGTAATKTATGWKIEFAPMKTNPSTTLTADITVNGATAEASLTWKRIEESPALLFTASAKVPLAAK